jgi:phenylacetic acid degradation operon negative regulatory protein
MSTPRNTLPGERTLSARSVVASTLLGASPPQLPVRTIVRCGELFGIPAGTVRTAVSRMLADGDLEVVSDARERAGVYRVSGPLLRRHRRQAESRHPQQTPWDGTWIQVVVPAGPARPASERMALRTAARTLRLAEVREGVWCRPDNLETSQHADAVATVAAQCHRFTATPDGDPVTLAATLWDLDGWAERAEVLGGELERHAPVLEGGDPHELADGFLLSAAVLRHLLADPLLPDELLGATWPGTALRDTYDRYDAAYKMRWRDWFRELAAGT